MGKNTGFFDYNLTRARHRGLWIGHGTTQGRWPLWMCAGFLVVSNRVTYMILRWRSGA